MSTYIHRPIVVYGQKQDVEDSAWVFKDVIAALAPDRATIAYDVSRLREPSHAANGTYFWLIPGSGGTDGGAIEGRWAAYRELWKLKVHEDERIIVHWAELELNETEREKVSQTAFEFRQYYDEMNDP